MEKYLFTDGTNVIREVESEKELQTLIESSSNSDKIRIWMFNSSEWITLNAYYKLRRKPDSQERQILVVDETPVKFKKKSSTSKGIIKKLAFVAAAVVIAMFIYNFTKVKWSKASAVVVTPIRPSNSPLLNIDSLIQNLEWSRGQKLDKVTRTNLRIRNTWPDNILLKLEAERDTSSSGGSRFYDLKMKIDNATGYHIDEGVVEYEIWNGDDLSYSDTIEFNRIRYDSPFLRDLAGEFKGDSISVKFLAIKSKSFNFCYSAEKESNYGNLNDRWFCK